MKFTKEQGMGDPLPPLRELANRGPDGLSSERVAVTATHLTRDLGFPGDDDAILFPDQISVESRHILQAGRSGFLQ